MGLLNFFKKDPAKDLGKAEELLNNGDAQEALSLAERILKKGNQAFHQRATKLADEARQKLIDSDLKNANRMEAEGSFAEAADWVKLALEHVYQPQQREHLEQRIDDLLAQQENPTSPVAALHTQPHDEMAMDLDTHFHTLIGMLEPNVTERYETQPQEFRIAYLALNSGKAPEATQILQQLLQANPEDPVILFELGRASLLDGDAQQALLCFEKAWPTFGWEFLDSAKTLSIPALWADCMLCLNDPTPILHKFESQRDFVRENPDLSHRYALALEGSERYQDAFDFLLHASKKFERNSNFPYHLAMVLRKMEQPERAAVCLETAIAPSCQSGTCSAPPLHPPSLRLLILLYLEQAHNQARVKELFTHLARALHGQFSAEDYQLLRRYHEQTGDLAAAAEATANAERLSLSGTSRQESATIPNTMASEKAVL